MKNFKKILNLLTLQERKRSILLMTMILIMALLDTIGVASILPFVTILTNPEIIYSNIFLNMIFQKLKIFGVENSNQFLFILGILVFLILLFSLIFKSLTSYAQERYCQMREFSIGRRLIEGYLHQPYSWFLNQHSADIGKTILSEVHQVVFNGILPIIEIIARGSVTLAIVILLVLVDIKLALIIGFSLGVAYGTIFYLINGYLKKIGKERLLSNNNRFTTITEAFGAAKEVKVGGLEQNYIDRFSKAAQIYARHEASSKIIGQLPRYALEAVAFGGIMLVMLYLISQKGSLNSALPIISLYVFAGYRLLPSLQLIYASLTQLSYVGPSLDSLNNDIKKLQSINHNIVQKPFPLNKSVTLNEINYSYPNTNRVALKNINLKIPAKSIVGFVGTTGSGKTTAADVILGLLEPQEGYLEVDQLKITKNNSRSWQRSIGYVPQQIYLSDDTISANIAFGLEGDQINQKQVENVAKIANLHNFIINELPHKYMTTIGERGIRISGGQRQRIGIARALYHNPQLLILDEATSALDTQTEKAVMDAVNNLSKNITIILIAHRLNTLKKCDIIFEFEKGELVNQFSYNDLKKSKFSNLIENKKK